MNNMCSSIFRDIRIAMNNSRSSTLAVHDIHSSALLTER